MGLETPVESLVKVIVEVFKVFEIEFLTNDHFVNTLHEITFKVAAFEECFGN